MTATNSNDNPLTQRLSYDAQNLSYTCAHVAGFPIRRKIEMVKMQVYAKLVGGSIKHPNTLGHHFLPNAISGDNCDAVFCHF